MILLDQDLHGLDDGELEGRRAVKEGVDQIIEADCPVQPEQVTS
ncbi:hypothetical protein [Lamprocystis purpurea]|jgi:hypothetical protein|nr:hypothetical protein [Lamprocystis purpurea]